MFEIFLGLGLFGLGFILCQFIREAQDKRFNIGLLIPILSIMILLVFVIEQDTLKELITYNACVACENTQIQYLKDNYFLYPKEEGIAGIQNKLCKESKNGITIISAGGGLE